MSEVFPLPLTDELKAFIEANSGDGSPYATADEFVRAVLRDRRDRQQLAQIREAVIEGYNDIEKGRTVTYKGSVRDVLREAGERGWLKDEA